MSTRRRSAPLRRAHILPHGGRLIFLRKEGKRSFYRDKDDPTSEEFFVLDTTSSKTWVPTRAEEDGPAIRPVHAEYPTFGPYFVDKDGREVFVNDGKPFYLGVFNGAIHKIQLGPRPHEDAVRSRASVGGGRAALGGTYRSGGVPGGS